MSKNKKGGEDMLKKALFLGLLVLLVVCTNVLAGDSGNCVEPLKTTTDWLGLGTAFEYNYVDGRLLKMNNIDSTVESMKMKELHQVYGKVIYGLDDHTNLYAKIGGATYDLEFKDENGDIKTKTETEMGLFTGLGINLLFPLITVGELPIKIGYNIDGNVYFNDVDTVSRGGLSGTEVDGSFYAVDGILSSYITCNYNIEPIKTSIIPYLGVYNSWLVVDKYDLLKYKAGGTSYEKDIKPNYDLLAFGVLLGLDVEIAKHLVFNIEGRLIGEGAVTTGATIKF